MSYPRDARVTGYIDPETGKAGLLVLWNEEDKIRTVFIAAAMFPPGTTPAPPKKAHER